MAEFDFVNEIAPGARGKRARLVQEWLSLHGHHVAIDNGFGAATEKVVKDFQEENGLHASGRVDRKTFELLVAPMRKALAPITVVGSSLG